MNPIVDVYVVLSAFDPDFAANVFMVAMLIIFFVALSLIMRGRDTSFRHFAPGLLTTLGILGTFLGISIGLVNFNVENIDASIPQLLEGLKMAFITSIIGVALSVLTKFIGTCLANGEQETAADVGPEQIYQVMRLQKEALADIKTEMSETRKAISGEADASLVTQIQKMRTTLSDGFSETRKALTADSDTASVGAQVQRMERTIAKEFRNFATCTVKLKPPQACYYSYE